MQEVLDHQYKGVHEIKWMCAISVLHIHEIIRVLMGVVCDHRRVFKNGKEEKNN